jgi:hypothetical protein
METLTYANDPTRKVHTYILARAIRLGTRLADGENYDPFLFVVTHVEIGEEQILPTF